MKELFYRIIEFIAAIHDEILHWNDGIEYTFTDKELHFLVFGACGLALFLLVHFVFKRLARYSITAISWIYTMTLMIGITLAIEIGQQLTNTGNMELGDILYGLWGFLLFFGVFLLARTLFRLILRAIRGKKDE